MCTRTLFKTSDGRVVTGRNMDWSDINMQTDLWAFKAGTERQGEKTNPYTWTSEHSSLVAVGYDCGVADGINDAGLVANMLYLAETEFKPPGEGRELLSLAAIIQYVLDTCENVNEVVESIGGEDRPFDVTAPMIPGGRLPTVHFSLSDASGDSAIFECIPPEKSGDPKLFVHHGKEYKVMANSPTYDKQLAHYANWRQCNKDKKDLESCLPGSRESTHRFIRASFYLSQLEQLSTNDLSAHEAAAQVLSVQRNVAQPPVKSQIDESPELARTLWTTIADSKELRYYYQNALFPHIFWVDLKKLPFAEKGVSLCLDMKTSPAKREEREGLYEKLHGEVSGYFEAREPFQYLSI